MIGTTPGVIKVPKGAVFIRVNRESSFLPTGQVWWVQTKFYFRHSRHLGDSLLFPCQGGRGVDKICAILNFPGGFVVFLSSLTSEERVSKQLKQVPSILGRITLLIPTTLKKCAKQKNIPKKQTQQKLVSYDLQIVDTSRLQKNSPNKKMFFSAF